MRRGLAFVRRPWGRTHPRLAWTVATLSWLPIGIMFTSHVGTVMFVTGRSMQPTLNPDDSKWRDIVIFDRFSIRIQEYNRGDIVALKSPSDHKLIVKRIIALGGDVVKTLPPYPDSEVRIPEGHAWVEGDEPFHSEDSNTFGPIPLGLVDSKATTIIWPPDHIRYLITPDLSKANARRGHRIRDLTWRREMNEFERERKRQARVVKAGLKSEFSSGEPKSLNVTGPSGFADTPRA